MPLANDAIQLNEVSEWSDISLTFHNSSSYDFDFRHRGYRLYTLNWTLTKSIDLKIES